MILVKKWSRLLGLLISRVQPRFTFAKKLKATKKKLKIWNKEYFGHCSTKRRELTRCIDEIQRAQSNDENLEKEKRLCIELEEIQLREEMLWKQKSRVTWLDKGEDNTRFFHVSTIIRRRRNAIDSLKVGKDEWISDRVQIGNEFIRFFKELFKSSSPNLNSDIDQLISPTITPDQNAAMLRIPSYGEIKRVVFGMSPTKAPGPDGMSSIFFQHYWETVGSDMVSMVQKFFRHGHMLKELNHTHITLIPKTQSANIVSKFRPISLCNVGYKVISKIIANRMKPHLDSLISPLQTTFIPGRTISENVVLTQEILHKLRRKTGEGALMPLKYDMAKAYDRVEWSFI